MAIKQYLIEPPILAGLGAGDTLYLYLEMTKASVSAVLFEEDENKKQGPIFFVSKSLSKEETRYTHIKQATLNLHVAAKKLCPYFQAHPIVVLTNLPLRSTIHKPDLSGRMARWAIELSEFSLQYKPRMELKGQILAYFLTELPRPNVKQDDASWWILNVDNASRQTRSWNWIAT